MFLRLNYNNIGLSKDQLLSMNNCIGSNEYTKAGNAMTSR